MCSKKNTCKYPEKLKTKPEECSPGQIEECHGKGKKHICVPDKKE